MKQRAATRGDWQTEPMPKRRNILHLERSFSVEEMARICMGLIPEQMEDKWFIFAENNTLFFHRSWTGFCVYIVELIQRGDSFAVREVQANRDPEQYSETDDVFDAAILLFLIDALLLGREAEFPSRSSRPTGIEAIQQWSSIGRAMLRGEKKQNAD